MTASGLQTDPDGASRGSLGLPRDPYGSPLGTVFSVLATPMVTSVLQNDHNGASGGSPGLPRDHYGSLPGTIFSILGAMLNLRG